MGLWPTHRDESALLRFIDSNRSPATFKGVLRRSGVPWDRTDLEAAKKDRDRLQLVEDYVYQMTLRPNPGRHRQVGRDHENATGTTCLAG
jgi:hypothetical protein